MGLRSKSGGSLPSSPFSFSIFFLYFNKLDALRGQSLTVSPRFAKVPGRVAASCHIVKYSGLDEYWTIGLFNPGKMVNGIEMTSHCGGCRGEVRW